MKVIVLGAGAIGAYYGGQLARAGHDVTLYARGDNLSAIRERGLEIKTPEGSSVVRVEATDRVGELGTADFAILGVKSYSLDSIGSVVKQVAKQGATIVPFLNGVETTDRLTELGVPRSALLGGVTRISVARVKPGVVERRGAFQSVVVGELDGRITDRATRVAAAFREAGADARASNDIELELWQKFVFIAALAASCGLARTPVGPLREQPLGRRLLQRAVQEVVDVARARGITLAPDETAQTIGAIDALPPGTKPSFLLDVEAGGPTEIAALSGAVSRYAESAGVDTPVHDTATAVFTLKK
ncbi:MAG TPA: 2-dehydropantoate 2-reductase [Gemmatimonadaceae bacterium]|nr:2-dehydropantoate 2-reductase [Gemmatimonadaceae bacterium]